MAQAMILDGPDRGPSLPIRPTPAPAAGLFGYSIAHGKMQSSRSIDGYIRDIEQMPNFAPPSMDAFVARYVASNIGKTQSSS